MTGVRVVIEGGKLRPIQTPARRRWRRAAAAGRAGWLRWSASDGRGWSGRRRRESRSQSIQSDVPVKPVWPIDVGRHQRSAGRGREHRVPAERARAARNVGSRDERPHGVRDRPAIGSPAIVRRTARAKAPTPAAVPKRPACPAAPPSAQVFSSCTSPTSSRPRQRQFPSARCGPAMRGRVEAQGLGGEERCQAVELRRQAARRVIVLRRAAERRTGWLRRPRG